MRSASAAARQDLRHPTVRPPNPGPRHHETCADGRFVAVGAIEPQFWAQMLAGLGLTTQDLPHQHDRAAWPAVKDRLAAIFATRTRDEWAAVFDDTDACVSPVLSPFEAHRHPHNAARAAFTEVGGRLQPSPAPSLRAPPPP
ncbi:MULTISPECIES: CoA transferase [unclassified Streptomyces]|uniref:CoA transferase n=1 Tax=unclassified Streptomyces TaxID=2593676 RepID=UPI0038014997